MIKQNNCIDNDTIKKAISACIKEFSGQYGRSGIAKILKGSRGLKDNGQQSKIFKYDFEFYNNEKLTALRRQFPLRLAYGITIHKSQGMPLDKLFVDCSKIFEKGQAYAALSRIKTLNGLYIRSFSPAKVMTDDTAAEFYKNLKIFNEKIR